MAATWLDHFFVFCVIVSDYFLSRVPGNRISKMGVLNTRKSLVMRYLPDRRCDLSMEVDGFQ
jgi:hypothetical protein